MTTQAVLQLKNIHKRFNETQVLNDVNFGLYPGEIHALLGENGAGKSTLIKVMTGVHSADAGEILRDGQVIKPRSPLEAQKNGISTVYQEVNLLPNLSVAHNLFLGREPTRFGCIQWKKMNQDAVELLKRFDLSIDVTQKLSSYSIAVQQMVAIARAIAGSAKVLILDEPTASLDAREVALLFRIMRNLKENGVAIIFVTHFLDQVYEITDRITILRNGSWVGTYATADLPRPQLVAAMLGKSLETLTQEKNTVQKNAHTTALLECHSVTTDDGIQNLSFDLHPGDAVGLAGLLGSGRTEVCNALFGLSKLHEGNLTLSGAPYQPASPAEAIKKGLALCPEDRKTQGIIDGLSVRENLILALQNQRGWWNRISMREQKQLAEQAIKDLKIACDDMEKPVGQLSGGNQQKVILARWLMTQPKIFIMDEPTRGIDIGAHAEILSLIRKMCEQGMTLLVASSEIEELVAFSNRILVMRDKALVKTLEDSSINEGSVLEALMH